MLVTYVPEVRIGPKVSSIIVSNRLRRRSVDIVVDDDEHGVLVTVVEVLPDEEVPVDVVRHVTHAE